LARAQNRWHEPTQRSRALCWLTTWVLLRPNPDTGSTFGTDLEQVYDLIRYGWGWRNPGSQALAAGTRELHHTGSRRQVTTASHSRSASAPVGGAATTGPRKPTGGSWSGTIADVPTTRRRRRTPRSWIGESVHPRPLGRALTATSGPWGGVVARPVVKPAQFAPQRRTHCVRLRCANVLVGPWGAAVAADVPAWPVPDGPGSLKQPLGQQGEQEHGRESGETAQGMGVSAWVLLWTTAQHGCWFRAMSVPCITVPRWPPAPGPSRPHARFDHHGGRCWSGNPLTVQARAGRVAGRHQRRRMSRADRRSARTLCARRQRSAWRRRSAWRCSTRAVADDEVLRCMGSPSRPARLPRTGR
jgi:hypothetical protein